MLRKTQLVALSVLLSGSLLVGCGKTPFSGETVASVNGAPITEREFHDKVSQMAKSMRMDPKSLDDPKMKPMMQMFERITIQNLILDKLIEQEAKNRKLSVSNDELEKAYERQIAQVGGEKQAEERLKELGFSKNDFKEQIRNQLLKDKVVTAIGGNKLNISDADVERFYKINKSQFDLPEQVHARHILIAANPKDIRKQVTALKKGTDETAITRQVDQTMKEKRQKAQEILNKVKANPKSFETIAKQVSDDPGSGQKGGDLGYFSREEMVPPFSAAAFSTKPGTIHDTLVETAFGFHIIQVLDRKAPQKRSYDDVKGQIREMLLNQRKSAVMEEWVSKQRKSADIDISDQYAYLKEQEQPSPDQSPMKTGKPKDGK